MFDGKTVNNGLESRDSKWESEFCLILKGIVLSHTCVCTSIVHTITDTDDWYPLVNRRRTKESFFSESEYTNKVPELLENLSAIGKWILKWELTLTVCQPNMTSWLAAGEPPIIIRAMFGKKLRFMCRLIYSSSVSYKFWCVVKVLGDNSWKSRTLPGKQKQPRKGCIGSRNFRFD